jgi:hypothetical protein
MATRDQEEVTTIAATSVVEIRSGIAPTTVAIDDTMESDQGTLTTHCRQTPRETEVFASVTSEEATAAHPHQLDVICDDRKMASLRLMNVGGNAVRGHELVVDITIWAAVAR